MDKATLQVKVTEGLSQRQISELFDVSQTTIRYWLRKFGLKTKHIAFKKGIYKCKCGEQNPLNFYGHKKSICKLCANKLSVIKANRNKAYGVEYLGGKCISCGYSKSMRALEFHHTNPSTKSATFNKLRGWALTRVRKELDQCILLCANCHAEEHERLSGVKTN